MFCNGEFPLHINKGEQKNGGLQKICLGQQVHSAVSLFMHLDYPVHDWDVPPVNVVHHNLACNIALLSLVPRLQLIREKP